jgi:HlyD family secretion protein
MNMKRASLWIGILLALSGIGYAGYRIIGGRKDTAPKFTTVTADRGPIIAKVTASGTLSAVTTVQVGSQVSGRIDQILTDFNGTVKKGDVIAKIDPQLFQAAVAQARANMVADQAALEKAKVQEADAERQYNRNKALLEQHLVAQADVDTAEANFRAAKATIGTAQGQVERDRAALSMAETNLNYTTITSPINGTVISRNVDVGQTVAASLQAPTLFTIAEDLHVMQIDTSVAEADVGKLDSGMAVTFTVDAFPGQPFKGTVRQIRNAAQTVQNVVTYDAVINVDNPELKLRPGMTANVTFVYADKQDALRIPNAALRFKMPGAQGPGAGPPGQTGAGPGPGGQRPQGGGGRGAGGPGAGGPGAGAPGAGTFRRPPEAGAGERRMVWVLRDNQPGQIAVKTGITDGTLTEVVSGDLKEGDLIITEAPGLGGSSVPPAFRRMF